jgi:hypothetical protein
MNASDATADHRPKRPPGRERPTRERQLRPEPNVPVTTSTADSPDDLCQVRNLAKMGGWTRRERLWLMWYRLRLVVQEMNYATRRMVELQMRLP